MKFSRLFEPITINRLVIENRYVMPAMGLHYTNDYTFNNRYRSFYRERARGGVGLMIIGPVAIDRIGSAPLMPGLFDDRFIGEFKIFNEELKRNTRARIGIQLFHMGRNAPAKIFTGEPALAPSPLPDHLFREMPREMTSNDIDAVQQAFADTAGRAVEAGFDYIEIIACTGYLISQFLSPVSNRRTDAYGGPIENRMRFGLEVIQRVRKTIGPDVAVGIRVAGNDFLKGGHTNRESVIFCVEAEKAGADAINVTGGWHETDVPQLISSVPPGAFVYLARGVKEHVSVPVFASNRLGDPTVAERALRSGSADMICIGRPLIADPELPRKIWEGRLPEIVHCISCNQGCFDSIFSGADGTGVTCVLNPRVGREGEVQIGKAVKRKRIFVAGGGPAGMTFALVAARRGHDVTLFEKTHDMGGQINLAAVPPGKESFLQASRSMENRIRLAGVKLKCGSPLTPEKIKSGEPDLLVIATGAIPMEIPVPGIDKKLVVDAWQVLRGEVPRIGKKVIVIGGNAVGCETADFIASEGLIDSETYAFLTFHSAEESQQLRPMLSHGSRTITLIEMTSRIGANVGRSTRWALLKSLREKGVRMRTGVKLLRILDDGVIVQTAGGEEKILADTVVLAIGSRPVNNLADEISDNGCRIIMIGDAKSPRKISDAVREGFEEALKI